LRAKPLCIQEVYSVEGHVPFDLDSIEGQAAELLFQKCPVYACWNGDTNQR
jgi:tRNA(Ser,Leu) C12 N-acetylase TAN1